MNLFSASLRPQVLRPLLLLALAGPPALRAWTDPGALAAPRTTSPEDRMRRRVMGAAEVATGGVAVTAARGSVNGAAQGWIVLVHMRGREKGWRCWVDGDVDPPTVRKQEAIDNPAPGRKEWH